MRMAFLVAGYLLAIIATVFPGLANATQLQAGKVSMGGQVFVSACTMHPDNYEQYLGLGSLSTAGMIRNGSSVLHPFSISLINCAPKSDSGDDLSGFFVTFEGLADGSYFALQGDSQGLALEIQDERGHIAAPGVPMEPHPITLGERTLNYKLRLVGNAEFLRAGNHFALLKYKLDYY
ncbi:MAG TPA: pilin [Serratia grimesii]|uniref:Pilin n=2 Tax=Serratia grimesii TaxID=82995 RepID=A0A9C7V724_9GAMM|nr:pilin [Serratia grimesii]